MSRFRTVCTLATVTLMATASAAQAQFTGPSSSQSPYLGVMQTHYGNGPLLVGGGQFYILASASGKGDR